jgi:hypothetical protein
MSGDAENIILKKMPVQAEPDIVLIDDSGRPSMKVLKSDQTIGYVSTTVNMGDIANCQVQEYGSEMVSWILGGGSSKIRITCHGDGEGYLEMKDKQSNLKSLRADSLGKWLVANGLTTKKNLQVINLNLCMGAKCNLTPAVIKSGAYTAADNSAVDLLAKTLGAAGAKDIIVTGSNEVVAGIEPREVDSLTQVGDVKLKAGQGVRKIQIPSGFPFDKNTLTMTIPSGWSIEQKTPKGLDLLTIKAPGNWTVAKESSAFARPVEAANSAFTFTSPTKVKHIVPSDGWMVDGSSVIAAAGWAMAGPQKLKFVGTGGTLGMDLQQGDEPVILERLAKSKAKASVKS